MAEQNIESGTAVAPSAPQVSMIVAQPAKLENLLETIDLIDTITERISDNPSGGGGATQGAGGQQGDDTAQSPRDKAIANLPGVPDMQRKLESHIREEIKALHKQIRRSGYGIHRKGSAHKANELYSKIRRLNSMISELYQASVEIIRRLYIRIIIDKQPVL